MPERNYFASLTKQSDEFNATFAFFHDTPAAMGTLSTGQENYTNRSSPRHAVSAPAEMMEPGSKKRMQGWTEVLSGAGCYVHAAELLAVGTVVRLRIEMNALTFDTWARVIRLARDGMGLGFFDTAESQRSVLKHWLEAEAQEAEEA